MEEEKASPTNSRTRTATEESSSHYSHSRTDERPKQKQLYHARNFSLNVPFQKNRNNTTIGNKSITKTTTMIKSTARGNFLPLTPMPPETTTKIAKTIRGEETPTPTRDDDELHNSHTQKSEIIAKLFPMGYRNSQSQATKKKSDRERNSYSVLEDTPSCCEDLDSPASRCQEETTKIRPVSFRPEVDVRLLFPMGHPECKEQKYNSERAKTNSTSPTSSSLDHEHCSDDDPFINMVISFDPTWDLLLIQRPDEVDHTATMVKSRLRKFHEIENYEKSILGKFAQDEDSSEESSTQLLAEIAAAEVNSSFATELSPALFPQQRSSALREGKAEGTSYQSPNNNSFQLGYHFDHKRFPPIDTTPEVDICFYPEEEQDLIERQEDFVLYSTKKYCNGSRMKTGNNPRVQKEFDFLSQSQESRNDVHTDDDSDSCINNSVDEEIMFLDESLDCCSITSSTTTDPKCDAQSPTDPTAKLRSLQPQERRANISPRHKLFLFMDKHKAYNVVNDLTTGCESFSTTSTEISPVQLLRE